MQEQMEKTSKAIGQVVAKAWQDEAFLARLKSDPGAVLKEHGVDLPSGAVAKVVHAQPGEVHIVIPPKPEGELSDEQLQKMSGGGTIGTVGTFVGSFGTIFCR